MSFNFNIIRIERRGCSLLEAMIALQILAFSMLGLSSVMLSTWTDKSSSRVVFKGRLTIVKLTVATWLFSGLGIIVVGATHHSR